ncbi:hypothetical protein [Ferruginibacter profundus]
MTISTILLDGVPEEFGIAISFIFFGVVVLALFLLIYFFLKQKNKKS